MVVGPHVLLLHVPVGELIHIKWGVSVLLLPVPGDELVGGVGGGGPVLISELILNCFLSGSNDLFSCC